MMSFSPLLARTKHVVCFLIHTKLSSLQALVSSTLASTSLPVDTLKTLRHDLCDAIATATKLPANDFSMADYAKRRLVAQQLIFSLGHDPRRFGLGRLAVEGNT